MSALRSSLCLTLVCCWITAASNVHAQQAVNTEVTHDAQNAPAATPAAADLAPAAAPAAADPAPIAAPLPPPPPIPPGAAGQWQWKGRTADTDRESLMTQGRILYGQIEDLREERSQYGVGFPIVLMSVGGGLAFLAMVAASEPDCYDCENDNSGATVIAIGGLAMALVGVVMLSNRVGPRRELGTQIKSKERELRSIEDRLHFSTMLGPNNLRGASLALSF